MSDKLLISKINRTPKQIFRITGGTIYNKPGWEMVSDKEELEIILKSGDFSLISIGNLSSTTDNTLEIAEFIKKYYDKRNKKYPIIINNTGGEELKVLLKALFKKE